MINRENILSLEFLKKSPFTGSHMEMRYRIEKVEEGLKTTIWPEPFNFITTSNEKKEYFLSTFDEDGILDAVQWMNQKLIEKYS